MALLRFKQAYLASGFELTDTELPDHLCVVLEYAATIDRERGRGLVLDHRAGPGAAADLAGRGRLALGRCGGGGDRHPAAAAGRRVGGRPPPRRRGTARGGGRPHAVRDPRLRPGARPSGRTHAPAHAVVPVPVAHPRSEEPADGRLLVGDRALPVPRDLRGRPRVALPLRQVRVDDPVLAALRGPDAADRQPAVPLRHARRRGRARDRPAGAAVVDGRGRHRRPPLPLRRGHRRAARGRHGAGGADHPHLPPAHRGTGLLGDHARWTR